MFNQKEYITKFQKDHYRSIRFRVRQDDKLLNEKLNEVGNVNQYLKDLIFADIKKTRGFKYINDEIQIDFELSDVLKDLIKQAEEADLLGDYDTYAALADSIDVRAKKEVARHELRESQWVKLTRKYCL